MNPRCRVTRQLELIHHLLKSEFRALGAHRVLRGHGSVHDHVGHCDHHVHGHGHCRHHCARCSHGAVIRYFRCLNLILALVNLAYRHFPHRSLPWQMSSGCFSYCVPLVALGDGLRAQLLLTLYLLPANRQWLEPNHLCSSLRRLQCLVIQRLS